MKRMRNKEREYFLIGFIALCQHRSSLVLSNQTGHLATPRFGLGPWIGARVASQRCPILRQGGPIIVEQEATCSADLPHCELHMENALASCAGKRVKNLRPERRFVWPVLS